jgi:hypothetical protein
MLVLQWAMTEWVGSRYFSFHSFCSLLPLISSHGILHVFSSCPILPQQRQWWSNLSPWLYSLFKIFTYSYIEIFRMPSKSNSSILLSNILSRPIDYLKSKEMIFLVNISYPSWDEILTLELSLNSLSSFISFLLSLK